MDGRARAGEDIGYLAAYGRTAAAGERAVADLRAGEPPDARPAPARDTAGTSRVSPPDLRNAGFPDTVLGGDSGFRTLDGGSPAGPVETRRSRGAAAPHPPLRLRGGAPSPAAETPAAKGEGGGGPAGGGSPAPNPMAVPPTPHVDPVDLAELLSRSAKKAYEELQAMSETYPGAKERRLSLLSFVAGHLTGFSRLLVLVRWLRGNPHLAQLVSAHNWLELQNDYVVKAADGLFYAANDRSVVREGNWDLVRAADALRGGARGRLPAELWARFGAKVPSAAAPESGSGRTLRDLAERYLSPAAADPAPPALRSALVSVGDHGLAKLRLPGRWAAEIKLQPGKGTGAARPTWELVTLKILVGSKSALVPRSSRAPRKGNAESTAADSEDSERGALSPAQERALLPAARAALAGGLAPFHSFLERTASAVLLELVSLACSKLRAEGWNECEVAEDEEGMGVSVKFWSNPTAITVPPPPPGYSFDHASLLELEQPFQPAYTLRFALPSSDPAPASHPSTAFWPPLDALDLPADCIDPASAASLSAPDPPPAPLLAVSASHTLPDPGEQLPIRLPADRVAALVDPADPRPGEVLRLAADSVCAARMDRAGEVLASEGIPFAEAREEGGTVLELDIGRGTPLRISADPWTGRFRFGGPAPAAALAAAEAAANARVEGVAEAARGARFAAAVQGWESWGAVAGMGRARGLAEAGLSLDGLMPLFSDPDLLGAPAPSCAPVLMPLVGHPRFFVMVAVCAPPSAPDAARFRAFLLGVRSGSVWTADEWNERMWWDPDAAAADVEAEGGDGEAKRKRAESEGSASPDGERRPRKRARTEDMGGIAPAPDPFDFAAGLDPPPDLPTLGGPDHSRLRASYEGLHRLCALARRLASIRACERDLNALGVPSELVQLPRQLCYRPCGDNRHADPRTAVLVVRRHYLVSTLQVDLSGRTDGFEDVLDKAGTRGVAGDLAIKVVPSGSGPKLCARFKLAEDGYPPLEFRAPSGPVEASLDKDKREVTLAVGTSGEAPGRELLAAARGMHVLGFLAWQFGAWRGHLDGAGLEAKGMGLVRWEGGAVVFRYTENLTVKVRWTESYRAEAGDDITLAQAASRGSFTASFGSLDGSPNPHAGFEAYYGRMLSEFWDVYRVLKDLQETAPLLGGVADLARLKAFGPVPLFPAPSDRDPGEDLWELHRIAPTLAKLRHRGRGFVLDMLRTETPQLRCVGIFDAAARAFRLGDGRFFPTFENGPLLPIPDVEAKAPVPFMVRLVAEVLALVDDRTLLPDDDAIPMPSTLHENGPPDAGSKLILTVPTAVGNSSAGTAVTTGTAITLPMVPRVAGMISRATVGLEVLDWLEHAVRERFKLGEVRVDRTNIGLTFNTGTLVQNHQPLRAILQIDWKTGAWQCTQLAAVKVEQMVTRRTASAPNALSPGTPGSADARSIPYILPGLKGDAKDTIDVRNTDRELGRLAKWLTSKLAAYTDSDPRAALCSIVQIIMLPPEALVEICRLMDLETLASERKPTGIRMLLTVPASVAEEDRPVGSPAFKVERDLNRLSLVLRFTDNTQGAQAGPGATANAGPPATNGLPRSPAAPPKSPAYTPGTTPGALSPPGPQLQPRPNRLGVGTPSPNAPGTPMSQASPHPSQPRPAAAGAAAAGPSEVDVVYYWNYRSLFQTMVSSSKDAPERALLGFTELASSREILKAFGALKVNQFFGNLTAWSVKGDIPDADKRMGALLAKLLERPVGFIAKGIPGSVGGGEGTTPKAQHGMPRGGAARGGAPRGGGPARGGKPASPSV